MNQDTLFISRLSRKSKIVVIAKVFNFLGLFGAVVILARLFSPELFGRYQQCWLLINTVVPILILGAPHGLNYLLPRADNNRERALYCWRFYLLISAAGLIFFVTLSFFPRLPALLLGNFRLVPLVRPVALFILLLLPSYCLESLLIINERPWFLLIVNAVYAVFFLLIHLISAMWGSLEQIFMLLAFLAFVRTVLTFTLTYRIYGAVGNLKEALHLPSLKTLTLYAGTLSAIGVVDVVTVQIDKYLVAWFYKGQEHIFAVYSLGAFEIPLVGIVLAAVSAVIMPEFSRLVRENKSAQTITLLKATVERVNLILMPLFVFLLSCGFVLIPFLFGEEYRPSVMVFSIYLFLMPGRVLLNHPLLIAAGLQRFALYGRVIDLVLNILLALLLLPLLGYLAPAVSTVIATYGHKWFQIIIIKRFLSISWRELYPWSRLFSWFGILIVFAVVEVLVINLVVSPAILSLALSSVLFGLSVLILYRKWYRR